MFEMGAKFRDLEVDCICKKCGELQSACLCNQKILKSKDSYFIGINVEKARGKDITRCGVLFIAKEEAQMLLKECKKKLASGGSLEARDGGFWLIIQGAHKEALKEICKAQQFRFKK